MVFCWLRVSCVPSEPSKGFVERALTLCRAQHAHAPCAAGPSSRGRTQPGVTAEGGRQSRSTGNLRLRLLPLARVRGTFGWAGGTQESLPACSQPELSIPAPAAWRGCGGRSVLSSVPEQGKATLRRWMLE